MNGYMLASLLYITNKGFISISFYEPEKVFVSNKKIKFGCLCCLQSVANSVSSSSSDELISVSRNYMGINSFGPRIKIGLHRILNLPDNQPFFFSGYPVSG